MLIDLISEALVEVCKALVVTVIMAALKMACEEELKYHEPTCMICEGNPFVQDHAFTPASQVMVDDIDDVGTEQASVSVVTDDEEADEDLIEKTPRTQFLPEAASFKTPLPPKKKCKFIKLTFNSMNRCRVACSASPDNVTRVRTYIRRSKTLRLFEHTVYLFQ